MKRGNAFSPLLQVFNIALQCAIKKLQVTNLELYMNDSHQALTYANDVNLIVDDTRAIERNADILLNDSKDINLALNIRVTKYMEIERYRIMVVNAYITVGINSYERTFKHLEFH